jgi:shikimate dehydrogenase
VSGSIRLAVTGNPCSHSKSPQIFKKFLEYKDLKGFYSRIAADSLDEAIKTALAAGITGLNVTSPFKEMAAGAADSAEDAVKKLKAANTLKLDKKDAGKLKISAFNTDYLGVYKSVKNDSKIIKGKTAFVLGAGGAGIAAAWGLSLAGFNVTVFNRTLEKAEAGISWIPNCRAERLDNANNLAGEADIIVNALPLDKSFIDVSRIKREAVLFDANYKNSPFSIKTGSSDRGFSVISGLKWLINQAGFAFEIFTGEKLPEDFCGLVKSGDLETEKIKNISLVGFMGSGKSTTGKYLAKLLSRDFIDIDLEIEKREKMSISEIFKNRGEMFFRDAERRMIKAVFESEKGKVISCGGGSVADSENRGLVKQHSFPVWLASSPEISAARITDSSRPLLNTGRRIEEAVKLYSERIDFYGAASQLIIDTSERGAQGAAEKIYEEISHMF